MEKEYIKDQVEIELEQDGRTTLKIKDGMSLTFRGLENGHILTIKSMVESAYRKGCSDTLSQYQITDFEDFKKSKE